MKQKQKTVTSVANIELLSLFLYRVPSLELRGAVRTIVVCFFTKGKTAVLSARYRATFLLVEKKKKGKLKMSRVSVTLSLLGVLFSPPVETFTTVKEHGHTHDRAMPYSNNNILMLRIIIIMRIVIIAIIIIIIIIVITTYHSKIFF